MNKILSQVKKDNLKARKEKNRELSKILTTLVSEIEIIGKNNGNRETNEVETIRVIEKFKKNAEQTCTFISKSNASSKELEPYIEEISIYESYLPKQMSQEELSSIIKDIVSNDSNTNIGKIMGILKNKYNGMYDGKMASKIIKESI